MCLSPVTGQSLSLSTVAPALSSYCILLLMKIHPDPSHHFSELFHGSLCRALVIVAPRRSVTHEGTCFSPAWFCLWMIGRGSLVSMTLPAPGGSQDLATCSETLTKPCSCYASTLAPASSTSCSSAQGQILTPVLKNLVQESGEGIIDIPEKRETSSLPLFTFAKTKLKSWSSG